MAVKVVLAEIIRPSPRLRAASVVVPSRSKWASRLAGRYYGTVMQGSAVLFPSVKCCIKCAVCLSHTFDRDFLVPSGEGVIRKLSKDSAHGGDGRGWWPVAHKAGLRSRFCERHSIGNELISQLIC
jgi:hypothetical protein